MMDVWGVLLLFPILFIGLICLAVINHTSTRIAAMVLGIASGLVCAITFLTGTPHLLHLLPGELLALGLLFPIMGIIGGMLALTRPTVAGTLMLVSGIGAVIADHLVVSVYMHGPIYILASLLLIPGGALAVAAREKGPAIRRVATVLGIVGGFVSASAWLNYAQFLAWRGVLVFGEALIFLIFWGLFPLMAIAGGVLALKRPVVAGTMMLLSGIIGGLCGFRAMVLILCPWVYFSLPIAAVFASLLLIPGGALALAARRKRHQGRLSS